MLKHTLLLIVCSVAAVYFKAELVHVLHGLLFIHNEIANGLGVIFSGDGLGRVLQSVIALMVIPIVFGLIVTFAHWMMKHEHYPHFLALIWISWTILLVSMLSQVA